MRSAVRLAGRGCVSDTRPPGVTCNAWDASDRWCPAALEKVWGHAAVGWARECPRIHGRNMQIAHGWGTPRPAVASRHSGGVIRLAAGQETRGWPPPTLTAWQAIAPARIAGAQAVEGVVLLREAGSTDVYLLQASGNAEGEAAADVSRPSCFARQVERSLLVRADGRTTDTEASHPRRALLAVGHLAPQRCRARCSGQSSIGLPVLASLVCDGMISA